MAYTNAAKSEILQVEPMTIEQHKVVSHEVARAMAIGARQQFGADWAISSTGIAGPGGGTEEQPVGLIYVAVAGPTDCKSVELRLGKRRDNNMDMASFAGLNLLRKEILIQKADI